MSPYRVSHVLIVAAERSSIRATAPMLNSGTLRSAIWRRYPAFICPSPGGTFSSHDSSPALWPCARPEPGVARRGDRRTPATRFLSVRDRLRGSVLDGLRVRRDVWRARGEA